MNLESLKYHLIEKIMTLQDETTLKKVEQILSENRAAPTTQKVVESIKENGIIQRRSIYRISDRPTAVETKGTPTKIVKPVVRRVVQAKVTEPVKRIVQTNIDSDSSLGKLQRLVRERALSNHALDI